MSLFTNGSDRDRELSGKDRILAVPFCLSALTAFALSFSLSNSPGRRYEFLCLLLICFLTLIFIDRKKDVVLASIVFIGLRVVWAVIVTPMH